MFKHLSRICPLITPRMYCRSTFPTGRSRALLRSHRPSRTWPSSTRESVCSEIPFRRITSTTGASVPAFFNANAICSFVYADFLICCSFLMIIHRVGKLSIMLVEKTGRTSRQKCPKNQRGPIGWGQSKRLSKMEPGELVEWEKQYGLKHRPCD